MKRSTWFAVAVIVLGAVLFFRANSHDAVQPLRPPASESNPAPFTATQPTGEDWNSGPIRAVPLAPSSTVTICVTSQKDGSPVIGTEIIPLGNDQAEVTFGFSSTIGKTDDRGLLQFSLETLVPTPERLAVIHPSFAPATFALSDERRYEVSLAPAFQLRVRCKDSDGRVVDQGTVDIVEESSTMFAGDIRTDSPTSQLPLAHKKLGSSSEVISSDGLATFAPLMAGKYSIGVRHPFMILCEADMQRVVEMKESSEIEITLLPILVAPVETSRYSQISPKHVTRRRGDLPPNRAYQMQLRRFQSELVRRYPNLLIPMFVGGQHPPIPESIQATAIATSGEALDLRLKVLRLADFRGDAPEPEVLGGGPRAAGTRVLVKAVDADGHAIDKLWIQITRDEEKTKRGQRGQSIQLASGMEANVPVGSYRCEVLTRTCDHGFGNQRIELKANQLNVVDITSKYSLTQVTIQPPEPNSELWDISLQCEGGPTFSERCKLPSTFWVRRLAPLSVRAQRNGSDVSLAVRLTTSDLASSPAIAVLK